VIATVERRWLRVDVISSRKIGEMLLQEDLVKTAVDFRED